MESGSEAERSQCFSTQGVSTVCQEENPHQFPGTDSRHDGPLSQCGKCSEKVQSKWNYSGERWVTTEMYKSADFLNFKWIMSSFHYAQMRFLSKKKNQRISCIQISYATLQLPC